MTMLLNLYILPLLILWPLLGLGFLLCLPSKAPLKHWTLAILLVEFILSLHLPFHFVDTGTLNQFYFDIPWIPSFGTRWTFGIDAFSLVLILTTTVLTPLALLATWNSITERLKTYLVAILFLTAAMIGVFVTLDLLLFYVFWEVLLVPMYILIGCFGGKDRVKATIKFFIFTMFGSVLMLVAFIYMYKASGFSFHLFDWYQHQLPLQIQFWLFLAMAVSFAIKVPLFPFHTWLPDAHVQAPTFGSVILAGILLKMGTYGFLRFGLPLFYDVVVLLKPWLVGLAVFGTIFGALVAMVQTDIKKLIAYSSISHMGLIMLGIFSLNPMAIEASVLQMLNHAVSTGALFILVGMIYDRTHTREIADYSGLAKNMPLFAFFFLLVTFSSIGVPLTNGFVGEFLILAGSFSEVPKPTMIAMLAIVLGAVYMLTLYLKVFFGPPQTRFTLTDLNLRERSVMFIFAGLILVGGLFPNLILSRLTRVTQTLISLGQIHVEAL